MISSILLINLINSKAESASNGVDGAEVVVSGKNAEESKYVALESFAESRLPEKVLECCKNFSKPSPIQSRAWPFLLDGRDFIGIAATGSDVLCNDGKPCDVKSICLYGGTSKGPQISSLKSGVVRHSIPPFLLDDG
ncbi:hypothetical protein L1049_003603 [Liquidambar formosana]|uniref:DEAD-box RNA helicase Q domain-containing protein n=1 Tax=Liquidambar formosana TaxID=63359 RepID=A0AAP0N5R7_LIQFO